MMTETAPTTDPRATILARIGDEGRRWQELVGEVGPDRMNEPGPMGEWSFKDLAAHLLGWRERTIARFEAAAEGRPAPPPPWPAELEGDDDDPVNDWINQQHRDRPAEDVLRDIDDSYERLATAIAALPEDMLTDPGAFPTLDGQSVLDVDLFGHLHEEHEPSVREWLARGR
jgi:uncharacterized protein (TIGR03083 family)